MQNLNVGLANIITDLVRQNKIDLGTYTPEEFADDIVEMSTLPEDFQRARADAWDEGYEAREGEEGSEVVSYGVTFRDLATNPYCKD